LCRTGPTEGLPGSPCPWPSGPGYLDGGANVKIAKVKKRRGCTCQGTLPGLLCKSSQLLCTEDTSPPATQSCWQVAAGLLPRPSRTAQQLQTVGPTTELRTLPHRGKPEEPGTAPRSSGPPSPSRSWLPSINLATSSSVQKNLQKFWAKKNCSWRNPRETTLCSLKKKKLFVCVPHLLHTTCVRF